MKVTFIMKIFNADDYGLTNESTEAINLLIINNLIQSTSIVVNTDYFHDAYELAITGDYLGKVGLHLNLSEGVPTSIIESNRRFVESGMFRNTRKKIIYSINDLSQIFSEFENQIKLYLNKGFIPTHLDSHHHYHNKIIILVLVIVLARKYNFKSVRILRNAGSHLTFAKRVWKKLLNMILKLSKLDRTDYFVSIEDYMFLEKKLSPFKTVEIMVHPVMSGNQVIDALNINFDLEQLLGRL